MNLCYLFSGQGSQFANMGQDLYQTEPLYKQTVDEASDVLNLDLADPKNFDDPANVQIAILTMSTGIARLLDAQLPMPKAMFGLSLGEYSALVSAKALSFQSGLKLVQDRSRYMDAAGRANPGAMAAVLNLAPDVVASVCDAIDGVYPANFNTEKQTVIGGQADAVAQASVALKQQGAKRVVPLKVAVASHTPLMQPASEQLATRLASVEFDAPQTTVLSNTLVAPFTKENLKDTLVKQLVSPTHFMGDVQAADQLGVDAFVEIGPGNTLSKLAKKTAKKPTFNIESVDTLNDFRAKLEEF
ncbi:ACP S-malonyltransferase [Nicoliella spurrieriana]|uniref:Malonyl CoA-acyl carrier protein transacylase n=1 Tax=Nicoliella spurrieriana TaxID=2925830 RepID=A0A976RTU2_9LACO|nr:ACP S-malonyltransferase [Nicoliella spurrieriana]UQS87426.1 ACP S-malonyltransferase [Nicoliella spurrieriana]